MFLLLYFHSRLLVLSEMFYHHKSVKNTQLFNMQGTCFIFYRLLSRSLSRLRSHTWFIVKLTFMVHCQGIIQGSLFRSHSWFIVSHIQHLRSWHISYDSVTHVKVTFMVQEVHIQGQSNIHSERARLHTWLMVKVRCMVQGQICEVMVMRHVTI